MEISQIWQMPSNASGDVFSSGTLNVVGISDLNQLIKDNLSRFSGRYDLIVGIPRSGLLAANLLALHLNIPLCVLTDSGLSETMRASRKTTTPHDKNKVRLRILVVDDSSNSGSAILRAKETFKHVKLSCEFDVEYLAIYVTSASKGVVDSFLRIVEQPRAFEWNFLHHCFAANYLFDLDGVLCEDGPPESSDDPNTYMRHLECARPKIIPTQPIGAVVTSRLEKYRAITEMWLKKHGVEYRYLIMVNLPSAEERRRLAIHGKYKADVYRRLGGSLFIESEAWQAKEIASLTGKAVYNLQDSCLLQSHGMK